LLLDAQLRDLLAQGIEALLDRKPRLLDAPQLFRELLEARPRVGERALALRELRRDVLAVGREGSQALRERDRERALRLGFVPGAAFREARFRKRALGAGDRPARGFQRGLRRLRGLLQRL